MIPTTDDFRSTKTFAAGPDAVCSTLADVDAERFAEWWAERARR